MKLSFHIPSACKVLFGLVILMSWGPFVLAQTMETVWLDSLDYPCDQSKAFKTRVIVLDSLGEPAGPVKEYYRNGRMAAYGRISSVQPFLRKERWVFWYRNGQRQRAGRYEQGDRVGIWLFWHWSGRYLGTEQFKKGSLLK